MSKIPSSSRRRLGPAPADTGGISIAALYAKLAISPSGCFVLRWAGPLAVTILAAVLRLWNLGVPGTVIFDETYYVKDAYSLLQNGYEAAWADNSNAAFAAGDFSGLTNSPEYVVHPPVGKWMIAVGMWIFGPESSFGWRFSAAVIGTLSVFMTILVARLLFRSELLALSAGLLLAIDGQALVMSRTGLLDIFLMFWALVAFWLVLLDRRQFRRQLDLWAFGNRTRANSVNEDHPGRLARAVKDMGPGTGMRWYLLGAGVALGLATGVKWSGVYFLAAFGITTVIWDMGTRRLAGIPRWFSAGLLWDGLKNFLLLVPVAFLTYLCSWAGWFATSGGWKREWASQSPGKGITWLPDSLRSLAEYHHEVYDFHSGLSAEHPYAATPLGWLAQVRPTSFFYETKPTCGSDNCSQAITDLGNPIIWWVGIIALLLVLYCALIWADWRAWAILTGYVAGYLPWFGFLNRTVFTFYSVAFTPWVILAVVYFFGVILGPERPTPLTPYRDALRRRRLGGTIDTNAVTPELALPSDQNSRWPTILVGSIVVAAVLAAAFFWPIWTGQSIPHWYWQAHMWLPSWI